MARKLISAARTVTEPWARRWGVVLSLVVAVVAGLVFIRTVLAVHDTGLLQLDGDARSSTNLLNAGIPPGTSGEPYGTVPDALDDWDRVCYQVAIDKGQSQAAATSTCGTNRGVTVPAPAAGKITGMSWGTDVTGANDPSIFTGGGSKDPTDISGWAYKTGTVQDKNDIANAYAIRYSMTPTTAAGGTAFPNCPAGTAANCDVIFFGLDRFSNNGAAQTGFWFLQNEVGLGPAVQSNATQGGFGFVGVHKPGDVLIVSDFSVGGTSSKIGVFKWDPTCTADNKPDSDCDAANLRNVFSSDLFPDPNAARCDQQGAGDGACGIVNPVSITMPWSFIRKNKPGGEAPNLAVQGEAYEAAINLSTLGLSGQCFATLVTETRSSGLSFTSTNSDFVVSAFAKCESGMTTTPRNGDGTGPPETEIDLDASLQVRDKATLTITGASSWSGTLHFYLCGPGTSGFTKAGGCNDNLGTEITPTVAAAGGTTPVSFLSSVATITAAGDYCWRASLTNTSPSSVPGIPGEFSPSTECFTVGPKTPTLPTDLVNAGTLTPYGSATATLGDLIADRANLTGTADHEDNPVFCAGSSGCGVNGGGAKGTITFNLYGPFSTAPTAGSCVPANFAPGFTQGAAAIQGVNGDGFYYSPSYNTTSGGVGIYVFTSNYSGDLPNNTDASHLTCTDPREQVTVTTSSTVVSDQKWVPNDHVQISATGVNANAPLAGTLSIKLHKIAGGTYSASSCTTTPDASTVVYTESTNTSINSTTSPVDVNTTNTGTGTGMLTVINTGASPGSDYFWRIVFTPSSAFFGGTQTKCELTNATINNSPPQ